MLNGHNITEQRLDRAIDILLAGCVPLCGKSVLANVFSVDCLLRCACVLLNMRDRLREVVVVADVQELWLRKVRLLLLLVARLRMGEGLVGKPQE